MLQLASIGRIKQNTRHNLSGDSLVSIGQDIRQGAAQDIHQQAAQDTHDTKDLALSQLDGGQATPPVLKASLEEISAFLISDFPQMSCTVLAIGVNSATIRYPVDYSSLRPGGTVSGPVMMAAADVALYVALLAQIGIADAVIAPSDEINDSHGIARDLTKPKKIGHWGNGDYEVKLEKEEEIDQVFKLIKQSYTYNK